MKTSLMETYGGTLFSADTPAGLISIRPGESSLTLDALLEGYDCETWAHLTAWNPGTDRPGLEENQRRQAELEATVRASGLVVFSAHGTGDDGWREDSLLILGVEREQAIAWAHAFRQFAIVFGCRGGPAELVDTCLSDEVVD